MILTTHIANTMNVPSQLLDAFFTLKALNQQLGEGGRMP